MYSILHISDLHRSSRDYITNDELVSSLVADRENYVREDPPIRAPDAIIVSGDLIQGVSAGLDSAAELRKQYDVALAFLEELTTRFVDGDKSRVIVVPGNHDVDWVTSRKAMALVGADEAPKDLEVELFRENSPYRWSWKTRELFRISDPDGYARRLDAYRDFFDHYYAGVPNLFRVSRGAEVNLFKLCAGRIGVAAFNSCHGNDCFSFHGSIPRANVARSHLDLKASDCAFDLRIAVWHHDIEGPPYRSDYMDTDIVRSMIGRGFRMGFFGHQHRPQAAPYQIFTPDAERMAVIGAGSLCAGTGDLPPGVHRQYNVVEIGDNFRSARVHVRQVTVANLFGRANIAAFGGRSYFDLSWDPPSDAGGRPIDADAARNRNQIEQAEAAFKAGNMKGVLALFVSELPASSYATKLLLEAAEAEQAWEIVVQHTTPPRSLQQLVSHFEAKVCLTQFDQAEAALDRHSRDLGLPDGQLAELRRRLVVAKKIKG